MAPDVQRGRIVEIGVRLANLYRIIFLMRFSVPRLRVADRPFPDTDAWAG